MKLLSRLGISPHKLMMPSFYSLKFLLLTRHCQCLACGKFELFTIHLAEALREAFLHTEERQVDKTGCINFNGAQYEVGMKLIGRKVEVLYDTNWLDEVEIHHKDFEPFRAKKLVIGENCQGSKAFPPKFTVEASESRLLTGLRRKAAKAKAVPTAQATHFSSIAKEVCVDV